VLNDEDKKILRELTHEIRRLRHGDLVARLTPAEMDELARRIADRLDERYNSHAASKPPADTPPARRRRRGYF